MAADCSQEAVLGFLKEKGGRVRNADLVARFQAAFPEEPERKAAVRHGFKKYVNAVAFVKAERGVKYVCLKKRFRDDVAEEEKKLRDPDGTGRIPADGAAEDTPPRAQVRPSPGSGPGNDSQVGSPRGFSAPPVLPDKAGDGSEEPGEMGNRGSLKGERGDSKKEARKKEARKTPGDSEEEARKTPGDSREEEARKTPGDSEEEEARKTPGDSEEEARKKEARKTPGEVRKAPDIPQITVVAASPLPTDASAFVLPGPAGAGGAGLRPGGGRGDGLEKPERVRRTVDVGDDGDDGDDGEGDARSLSGSEGSVSPKPSRRRIARSVMGGSPPPRRRAASGGLSPSDSLSLASSNGDEDRLALDPLEHEWMMSSSDGEWAGLRRLLAAEPGLLPRRDFVTGFSCLHWAAKLGKPELLARLVDFAERSGVPAGVDVRSGGGYTPLHVAAMHGHVEVVKLLVGAYGADVDVRDYGGRKASHYLADDASVDIRDIVGACGDAGAEDADTGDSRRRKRPNVLRSKPRPPGLRLPPEGEVRTRRKTSFSRMKPKLERLRLRTSQIVHSASFWDKEDQEPPPDSFRSRPKTHFLG